MSIGWGQCSDITWYENLNCDDDWTVLCEFFDLDDNGEYSDGEEYIDINGNGIYDTGDIDLWGQCYNIDDPI